MSLKNKILGILTAFALMFSSVAAIGIEKRASPRGEFKGYVEIESHFANFLFSNSQFSLGNLLGMYYFTAKPVLELLGAYQGIGAEQGYVNGKPNATNMFLWEAILTRAATGITEICANQPSFQVGEQSISFHEDLVQVIQPFCLDPHQGDLLALWELLVGYEAYEEYLNWKAWVDEFLKEESQKNTSYLLKNLVFAAFLNPYFLLEA